jgi:tetratricopeptide (TPR) repeat protein
MKLPSAKRIVRDLSVLLMFCGAFYAVVVFVNNFQAAEKKAAAEDFSAERLVAEEAAAVKDWDLTQVNLELIIDRDPHDGRAQYLLAKTVFLQLVDAEEKLKALGVPSPAPSGSSEEAVEQLEANAENLPASDEVIALEAEIDRLLERGLKEFERAHQFLRYRVDAMEYLAKIHVTMGQEEEALGYLKAFVDAGRVTRRGLYRDPRFGRGMQFDYERYSHRREDLGHGSRFHLGRSFSRGLQSMREWIAKAPVNATKLHRSEKFRKIVEIERRNFERGHTGHLRHH